MIINNVIPVHGANLQNFIKTMKYFRFFFVLIRYFYNFVPAKLIKTTI